MLICEIFDEILIIQISPRQNIPASKHPLRQNVGVKPAASKGHVPQNIIE
jgi:hypothetical protein